MRETQAVAEGAENLLLKACRKLEAGDDSAATAYVERTIALPFQDEPGHFPALDAAHLVLLDEVVGRLEEAMPEDSSWLDHALLVLDECGTVGGLDLKQVLQAILNDYEVNPVEKKRIKAVTGSRDHESDLEALVLAGEVPLPEAMRQILWTAVLYRQRA